MCSYMTSHGSPYARFQRALRIGRLSTVRAAAAELPRIDLDDALAICLLIERQDGERYERAVVRWLARLAMEVPAVGIDDLREGLVAFEALPYNPVAARETLASLCDRHGLRRGSDGSAIARVIPLGQRDLAVDLGTANTLVFERGRGIIVSEPSVVAVDSERGDVYAVGAEAHRMIGRTPATISATRPLRHGVIADFEVTEQMLRYFLRKAHRSRWARQRVVMCVPSGVTDVETRAVEEACLSAGAREVALIEEPIAAAIGAGLDIAQPTGHMVVDIGGGTSEVAVLSMGEIVVESSLRLGGYDLDEAIMAFVRREHNLAIGQPTAEEVKLAIGAAGPVEPQLTVELRGRELVSGLPKTVVMTTDEARAALAEPVEAIVEAVRDTLDRTPPELSSDILSTGILLAGGGALLHGLEQRLHDETQMPTRVADSALTCVAEGAGQALEEFEVIARRHAMRRGARRARTRRGTRART